MVFGQVSDNRLKDETFALFTGIISNTGETPIFLEGFVANIKIGDKKYNLRPFVMPDSMHLIVNGRMIYYEDGRDLQLVEVLSNQKPVHGYLMFIVDSLTMFELRSLNKTFEFECEIICKDIKGKKYPEKFIAGKFNNAMIGVNPKSGQKIR